MHGRSLRPNKCGPPRPPFAMLTAAQRVTVDDEDTVGSDERVPFLVVVRMHWRLLPGKGFLIHEGADSRRREVGGNIGGIAPGGSDLSADRTRAVADRQDRDGALPEREARHIARPMGLDVEAGRWGRTCAPCGHLKLRAVAAGF